MAFVGGLLVGFILGIVVSVILFVWAACDTFAKS